MSWSPRSYRRARGGIPTTTLSVVVVCATSVAVVATTAGPRRDLDYWWHVLLGQALLAGDASAASAWSVWPGDPHWRTAQPLAEIALALNDQWWQGAAPATVRALTAAMAMTSLSAATQPWLGGVPTVAFSRWWAFGWGAVVILGFTQERPAQMGLILMPLAGACAAWLSRAGQVSNRQRLVIAGGTALVGCVWTLSHQSWLLAWTVVAVVVVLSPRPATVRATLGVSLAGVMAWGWVTVGPPWQAIATARSAEALAEWQPTALFTVPGTPALAMVVGCAAALAMSLSPPATLCRASGDTARYAALFALGVAGVSAWRHVPVTVLAAGPLMITHMRVHAASLPVEVPRPDVYTAEEISTLPTHGDWARLRPIMAIGVSLALAVMAVHGAARVWPPPATEAERVSTIVARHVCSAQRPLTIATHYNHTGPALAGARATRCPNAAESKVVLDGRADRYGADALRRWHDVINAEGPRWERDWHNVTPDIAVLSAEAPLHRELRHRGWWLAERKDGIVVLYRPD